MKQAPWVPAPERLPGHATAESGRDGRGYLVVAAVVW